MKVVVQRSEKAIKTFRLLSNLTIKNIISFLKENGPNPPSAIARSINISPSTASRCLQELKNYGLVEAKWKTTLIDDRPLKLYTLVPNVLRFEFVLNEQKLNNIKPENLIEFKGNSAVDFKDGENRGVYTSIGEIPFRFDGLTADILKEVIKGGSSFGELLTKFGKNEDEFNNSFRYLLTLGLIGPESKQ